MCGICGIVSHTGQPDPALVDAMRASLVPRGPDEGSTDAFGGCVLGHQRLRVLDLETGSQPVTNERGDVVAVFNGELYNFAELREELAARGHQVPGTGDTPVIPHLYEDVGPRLVEQLTGMFALAVWDAPRRRLLLARDRFGKKPLLWTQLRNGTIAFASELKALLLLPGIVREPDVAALDAYLALQYVPGTGTGLSGIHRLAPGHVLVAEAGEMRIERYWHPEPRRDLPASEPELLELVREEVVRAVRRRLRADVPLGVLLSGGIDSSVVVAAAAEAASEPLRTFTVGFADDVYDERQYAREVAGRFGAVHEEAMLETEPLKTVFEAAEAFDQPLGDEAALANYLISRVARQHVTVALTGDGGDEAFAGYERYVAHGLASRAAVAPSPLLRLAARTLRRVPSAREPRSTAVRAARLLETAAAPAARRYGVLVEIFPAELRKRLWTADALAELGSPRPAADVLGPPPAPGITGLQLLDAVTYLPDDILLKADTASMASSLELRSPFLDHELFALALGLPDSLKFQGRTGKIALRRAFADELQQTIAGRPKRGLGVPLARWFREELRETAHDLLLGPDARSRGWFRRDTVERLLADHAAGRAEHGHRLWCLLTLELWTRLHVESPASAAATLVPS